MGSILKLRVPRISERETPKLLNRTRQYAESSRRAVVRKPRKSFETCAREIAKNAAVSRLVLDAVGEAAVDHDVGADDKARRRAGDEGHGVGDIFRRRH